jgi:redox-sensing transcriptional repressor
MMGMDFKSVGAKTVLRLPKYLCYLKSLPPGALNVSATAVAEALSLNDVQVRKDLALVSKSGRPRTGYVTKELIFDLEQFLGYNNTKSAVLAGRGIWARRFCPTRGFWPTGSTSWRRLKPMGRSSGKPSPGNKSFPQTSWSPFAGV